jgi:type III secretion protein D
MTRLRILTGRHAGAHLDLADGVHVVGASNDCDVLLTDWTFAPLELSVAGGPVSCRWFEGPTGAGGRPEGEKRLVLTDLVPREFDGIVLCVGPADGAWPSDVELLSLVFAPTPKRVARWARDRLPRRLVPAMLAAGVVSAVVMAWPGFEVSATPPPLPTLEASRALVQHELDRVTGGRLVAVAENGTLFLTGLAEDAQDAAAGRAAVDALRVPYNVVPRFAVATAIAETLRGTGGLTNPTVRHEGSGVFSVTAEVTDERAARAALDRIAADLAPAVTKVNASFERIFPNDPLGPILSRSQQEGLSVVQTRDGVKHIVIEAARTVPAEPFPPRPDAMPAADARPPAMTTAHATSLKGATP